MWCFDGNEVYYTIKEAAEMIGVSYWIIQRRFRKGLIKGGIPKTSSCSTKPFHPNLVPLSYIKAEKSGLKWRTELRME